jgi:hypothetical protein
MSKPIDDEMASMPSNRLNAALFAAGFSIWRLIVHDYWGVAFGAIASFCLVIRPINAREATTWRRNAVRCGMALFVLLTLTALWRSIYP